MGNRLIFLYCLREVRARTEEGRSASNGFWRKHVGRSVGIKRTSMAEMLNQADPMLPRKVAICVIHVIQPYPKPTQVGRWRTLRRLRELGLRN